MDYKHIDELIIARIGMSGAAYKVTFLILHSNFAIRHELDQIKKGQPARKTDKILDGRLQALKQQRKIRYDGKNGWALV